MALQLIQGNIERIKVDATVISANRDPFCSEGVDRAVFKVAGEKEMLDARKLVGKIEVGQAVYTEAFSLPAKYVIHTVSPMWRGGQNHEEEMLSNCYRNSLLLAKELGCKSIAFPLIGTKSGRIPGKVALQIAHSEIESFLQENETDIILVLYDEKNIIRAREMFSDIEITVLNTKEPLDKQLSKRGAYKKSPYFVSEAGMARYTFEHRFLRDQFFGNTRQLVYAVLQEDGLYDLSCKVAELGNWKNPYSKTEFQVDALRWNADISIIAIELPNPEYANLCYRIYMLFSDKLSNLGFYAIEVSASGNGYLCGWERNNHINYHALESPEWTEHEKKVLKAAETGIVIKLHAGRFGLQQDPEK